MVFLIIGPEVIGCDVLNNWPRGYWVWCFERLAEVWEIQQSSILTCWFICLKMIAVAIFQSK